MAELDGGRRGFARLGVLVITEDELAPALTTFRVSGDIADSEYYTRRVNPEAHYPFILSQASDRTSVPAAQATSRMIADWRPHYIFLVGTAGGVIDHSSKEGREGTKLGDVIVGDFIDYTEFKKFVNRQRLERKAALDHPSVLLRDSYARKTVRTDAWRAWIDEALRPKEPVQPPCAVHFGNIAAGEKIYSDWRSPEQKRTVDQYDKALAFETESWGVARQVYDSRRSPYYNPMYLTIRGISDYVNRDDSNEVRASWSRYAASCALAFARALAEQLLGSQAFEDDAGLAAGEGTAQ